MLFKKQLLIPFIVLLAINNFYAQIINGTDTLYGNEWINYSQTYFKINVSSDGIYRIPSSALTAAGIPLSTNGNQLRLFRMGKEVPIFTTTSTTLSNSDFIEFYGMKNKSDFDAYMYKTGGNSILNPDYSLITDTISYFLTWVNDNSVGKRIENQANNLVNAPAKEAWFRFDDRRTFSQLDIQYKYGDIFIPELSKGEGYGTAWAKDFRIAISPLNRVTTEGGQLNIKWTNQQFHIPTLSLNNELLSRDTISNFTLTEKTINLSPAQMKSTMDIALSGNYSDIDRVSVGLAQLTYARQFNFENKNYFEFNIEASNSSKYLEIDNFNTANIAPILYDFTNNIRITTILDNGKIKVVIPPSTTKRKLALFNSNTGFQSITTLDKANFRNFKKEDPDYIIITSDKFINDGIASEYAQYRQSAAGGGYKPLVVNIKDLYDNFGYGIRRHPMAIRDFTHFIKKNWTNPKSILLIGKAREFNAIRSSAQLNNNITTFDIPTWGYPGGDVLMVASNSSDKPLIPIGRIAASTPAEVRVYLEKIKGLEFTQKNAPQTIEDRDFFKNILHLSGGGSVGEPIKNQLKSYADILSKGKSGAFVSTFYKNSVDPVEIAQNDKIFDRINKGLSLITFFGHSATSVLEFDVNNPNLLNNKNKTPVFFALGCSAGNVHQSSVGVSENFIFYPNKGMSAFIGTSGTSYLSSLSNIGNNLYDIIANSNYGSDIGTIIQKTIERTGNNVSPDVHSAMQSFTINGDPSVKINAALGPDYIIDATTVKINPSLVTAQVDSINVQFDVVNIGTALKDTIKIAIKQQLSDGTIADLKTVLTPTPQYRSTLDIKIPLAKKESVGVNRLFISLDTDNKVAELPAPSAESNNELLDQTGKRGYEFLILANNVVPAYPANFSIIGKTPVVLKATTSNPLASAQNYLFELDTTQLFNSPLKRSTTLNSKGGVLKWQPTIDYKDSTVYYWRAAIEPTNATPPNWQYGSFTYITGKNGWAQGHYFQFLNNQFVDMKVNEGTREMEYVEDDLPVDLKGNISSPSSYPTLYFNSQYKTFNPAGRGGISDVCFLICVFDSDKTNGDGDSWKVDNQRNYGYASSFTQGSRFFIYDANSSNTQTGRQSAIKLIEDIIPTDKYVLFYVTSKDNNTRLQANMWLKDSVDFGKNIFQVLEKQGAKTFRNIIQKDSVHYFIVFKKNGNNVIREKLLDNYVDGINETFNIPRKWYTGTQSSQLVGRSKKWDNLNLSYSTGIGDTLGVDIIGVSENKTETTLKTNITANSINLSDIDATKYPYLKLKYTSRDIRQQTPPQLKSWRIFYQGLPDLAVNTIVNYSKYTDTIQQGDKFAMSVGIENISDFDADSVAVALTLKNEQNQEVVLQKKIQAIAAGNTAIAPYDYNTKPLEGKQQVFFEVNPKLAQPESFTGNNYLQTNITVQKDKTNPLLDVTFDGLRILNNDIVSSKPQITIKLKDDNKYLAMNDTALFKLVIEPVVPAGMVRTIYFNDPSLKFTPATINAKNENSAIIEFSPNFLKDGTYRLIIRAQDASGNNSGNTDYTVQFRVITKQSISNLLPYPNPFSTSARFAYTLTGDTPPQYMTIQIMTVSGKVVREITQNELGMLKIGTHLTDYAWDGKDDFGNRLANGVYLYRVITKDKNKQKIEKYNSEDNSDVYFKKDIGKIVIMR